MPECDRCDAHISRAFVRVFAGSDGMVHGCPACMSMTDIADGGATQPE